MSTGTLVTRPGSLGAEIDLTRGENGEKLTRDGIERRAAVLCLAFGWTAERVALAAHLSVEEVERIRNNGSMRDYVRGLNIEPGCGLSLPGVTYR